MGGLGRSFEDRFVHRLTESYGRKSLVHTSHVSCPHVHSLIEGGMHSFTLHEYYSALIIFQG